MKTKFSLILVFTSFYFAHGQNEKVDFSNPALINGSSWGAVFQRFYKNGDFDSMMKLTSDESLRKFGRDTIRNYYERMDFGYKLKLKSWTRTKNHFSLNYEADILATRVIIRMELESVSGSAKSDSAKSDSVKIILPDNFKTKKYFLYQ